MKDFAAIVIGRSGQVGRGIEKQLRSEGYSVFTTSSKGVENSIFLDLADSSSIKVAFEKLKKLITNSKVKVFLVGAMTHVDQCEEKKELCRKMNVLGPKQVATECKNLNWDLIFVSSEYVFGGAEYHGGKGGPFSELDQPEPTCEYGRAKLDAELAILDILSCALILRTTMVYSWEPRGMNFLMQYLRHLHSSSKGERKKFKIPKDQISTPTFGPALSKAAIELAKMQENGIYNLVGPDLLSRKELVEKVGEFFGYSPELVNNSFEFVKTAELGQMAKRPLTAGLTMDKANAKGISIPSLDQAFAQIKTEFLDRKEDF